jgi:uncharacterized protein (TIGR02466 family)
MAELEVIPQWVTPLVRVRNPDHGRLKPGLVAHAYERERRGAGGVASGVAAKMKDRLYESPFDLFRDDVAEVQALARFCSDALGALVTELRRRLNRPQGAGSLRIDMAESWVHITRDGGYHDTHLHPNCSWCGIYYVEPGDATLKPPNGVNRFYPPLVPTYHDFGTTALLTDPADLAPDEGTLVLFPSYIHHSAIVYRGQKDRVIISFNARVREVQG